MRIIWACFVCFFATTCVCGAVESLDSALRATYMACVGIDDELADLKKMAGINTAITGVGTVAGAGATVVGLVKANKDKQIANLEKELEKLHQIQEVREFETPNRTELMAAMDYYYQENKDENRQIEDTTAQIEKLTGQSKSLGNWRTGLMAGNTVTNISGAIIAGNNKVDADLQTQIDDCKAAVKNLRDSIMQARMNGEDISEANTIANACGEYNYVDVSKINNRAKGAMVSSVVGATTGVAGTVTSAIANTDATRNDNSDAGKQKEQNLNTAANVLAGASTVASGVATVFNATQIAAIKKVAAVAESCTRALK